MDQRRVVVVTGAARGIGYSIAEAFANNGDRVVIGDLNEEAASDAARRIADQTSGFAEGHVLDVTQETSVRSLVEQMEKTHGRIDVVINNAGLQHIDRVEDFPLEKWKQLIDVMLTGPFLLTKYTVPVMKRQQYGRIINISSVHGRTASPFKSAYVAAKHGVVGLTRTVALEVAEFGITVNAIMPGAVDTPLVRNQLQHLAKTEQISQEEALHKHLLHKHAIKRFVKPEEVAACALYLASDAAAIITGECIGVSGGW
ncbi:3-hydroxybutyrate dehydrogenase [Polycladomyces subterraneus]|uniref:3-hydroxybutyrate dehydrogenase n=1 Tax=Polycladomyces subterraneus TaxID=1016997 RepID=A0ABT8IK60_9BACL|nr:3-hydroxybutyrate dehydrogenase [Polycladomyces subterraneus]MDN4592936.1 3-hydroxybutyrate dehydrogenase [Polycladomyces subterraneus]